MKTIPYLEAHRAGTLEGVILWGHPLNEKHEWMKAPLCLAW